MKTTPTLDLLEKSLSHIEKCVKGKGKPYDTFLLHLDIVECRLLHHRAEKAGEFGVHHQDYKIQLKERITVLENHCGLNN